VHGNAAGHRDVKLDSHRLVPGRDGDHGRQTAVCTAITRRAGFFSLMAQAMPPIKLPPLCSGQAERRTQDYTRHRTTPLLAALELKSRRAIG
jgi:hypothetical protein